MSETRSLVDVAQVRNLLRGHYDGRHLIEMIDELPIEAAVTDPTPDLTRISVDPGQRAIRVVAELRAWLDERQKWTDLPGDTVGHYGLAARDTLRELDRLERQP